MTVAQAAEHFNVSKEAIHNRIRRGTLDCVIEHGVKYVSIDEPQEHNSSHGNDERYYSYIEAENERLKERVEKLENQTQKLRDQREQMLIDEREKIEAIYKERDLQLRNVLNVVASKFLSRSNASEVVEEAIQAELIEEEAETSLKSQKISLKKFLKIKAYKAKREAKVKKRFEALAHKDERIKIKKGKIYLDPGRFDYSDLLKK